MSEKLGNVRKSTGISNFLLFWVEMTPPETFKNHWYYNGFGEGPRKDATFHQKGDFWCPGECFFWWFSWKNHDFLTFPPFWWKGHLSAPPYAKACYGNAFSMVLGGTVSPKSRNNVFQLFPNNFTLFMFSWKCENSEKTPKSTNFLRLGRKMTPGIHWKQQ